MISNQLFQQHQAQHASVGKNVALITLVLAFFVIALGAFTRLTDAGLGCPDWPGCYGRLMVPQTAEHIAEANSAYPLRQVEQGKAWAEMVHRYLAGALGLFIFYLAYLNIRHKTKHRKLTIIMSLLVIMQAALGMWTVTLGLKPVIVMLHLMGGFSTFCLLFLLNMHQQGWWQRLKPAGNKLQQWRTFFTISCFVLILQVALGGWTAANYSAAVCTEFPICQGDWQSHLDFKEAFKFWGHGVEPYTDGTSAYEFATHLTPDVKMTIHIAHRIGAIVATLLTSTCIFLLWRIEQKLALGLALLLSVQVILGISNVILHIPLAVALAHNLVAVLLLSLKLTTVIYTFNPISIFNIGSSKYDLGNHQYPNTTKLSPSQSPSL